MKIYLLLVFIYSAVSVGCQNDVHKQGKKEQIDEIIDTVPQMPYTVEEQSPNVALPESLSRSGKGNAVLNVFVNEKGKTEGFNLIFLRLVNNDLDTLKHYKYANYLLQTNEYPEEIQKFLPFFKDYVDELRIVKKENVPIIPNENYILEIPLKLE